MGVHQGLVAKVEQLLRSKKKYNMIEHNMNLYDSVNRIIGEVDLFAMKENYLLLFEMKSHYTHKQHKKAKFQLSKEEKFMKNVGTRVFKFEVFYNDHTNTDYTIKRIR